MVADCRHEKGQSSVELLVAAAVLIPLILLIPTLANLLSVQTEAHKAARYVAWERTAYPITSQKTDAFLAGEVHERFLRDPESGFGATKSGKVKAWSDFGGRGHPSVVDFNAGVAMRSDVPTSSTSGFRNASARLDGVGRRYGEENAIRLRTQENTRLSIPIPSSISLLNTNSSGGAGAEPEDPIAGGNRFHVSSATALVADSWVPANENMYFSRVSDLTSNTRAALRASEVGLARTLSWLGLEEIDEKLFRGEASADAFEMVDDQQSVSLPQRLTAY